MSGPPEQHARRRFDEHWQKSASAAVDPGERRRLATIAALCPAVDSLLEVGCGSGQVLRAVGGRARLRIGCDSSRSGLLAAAGEPDLLVLQAAADRLPFADRSVDLVASCDVLEHLPAAIASAALTELCRVANRYVLLNLPLAEDLGWSQLRCPHCQHIYHRDHHQRSYRAAEVAQLLPPPQFAVVASVSTGAVVRHPLPLPAGLGAALGLGHRPQARCERCGQPPGPQPAWQKRLGDGFIWLHNALTRPLAPLVTRDTELVVLFRRLD